MTFNWRNVKLGDIADVTKLAGFEFTKYIKYDNTGEIIALRALNIRNGTLDLSEIKKIKKEVSNSLLRSKLYANDILLTYTGNGYGDCAIITENDKFHLAPNVCKLTPKLEFVNPYYLYTYIRSRFFYNQMSNYIGGSGQPTIPMKTIRILKIPIVDLETQQKIVKVLSAIDDKIELNNSINNNLEQQAQAIFKSWFVDFEPFGGTMPDDWCVGCLSDIATITMGQSPSGSSYNENKMGTLFFQGRAEFGYRYPKDRLYTTEPKRIAKANDILISVRAPVGDINIALKECCIGRGLAAIEPKNRYNSFVLYSVLNLKKQLNIFNGEGTVFGSINKDSLNGIKTLIPSKEIVKNFEKIVSPMDNLIKYNCIQNEQLTQLRDTLLPKLMSGKIDVSKVDIDDILENPSADKLLFS